MGAGRPTTYTKEVVEKAKDYIANCPDQVPLVVGLCQYIGRSKSTVYSWARDDDKKEFLDVLEQIEELQEVKLIKGGLSGEFNSPIAKMMLTKHGYSDKVQQDNVSSDGSMTPKEPVTLSDFYATNPKS